jgi:hypothetical protein
MTYLYAQLYAPVPYRTASQQPRVPVPSPYPDYEQSYIFEDPPVPGKPKGVTHIIVIEL